MGKGITKRLDRGRKLAKWADVLRALGRHENEVISDLDAIIREGTAGRALGRGERDSVHAMLARFVRFVPGGGMEVMPSVLKTVLARLPAPRPAPLPRPVASTPPVLPPAAPVRAEQVAPAEGEIMPTQIFRFAIMASEARLILEHLVPGGRLVSEIVEGRSKFGPTLWSALVEGGYVKPRGRHGRYTQARVDSEMFAGTRFVLAPEGKRQFKKTWKRPQDLVRGEQTEVAANQFLRDLERIARDGKQEQAAAPVAAPAPATARAPATEPLPNLAGARALLEVVRGERQRALEAVREEARPYLERLEAAQAALDEAESALANLARAAARISG